MDPVFQGVGALLVSLSGCRHAEELLQVQNGFRTNAFLLIQQMVEWCTATNGSRGLVDEIIHSILFLGKITIPSLSPEEIFGEVLDGLKNKFPEPFGAYETRLPRRSPFSCVLDMVVLRHGPENENQIKQILGDLVERLQPGFLVSSTICVSKSNNSSKQYGVSMSTTGPNAGRIVIAASCLSSYWDDFIAGAVMTYYPEKTKKQYFDGTIRLPAGVTCKAYNINGGSEMEPCKSCGNLFGLHTTYNKEWPYGNCAEVESLSNIFKKIQKPNSNPHQHLTPAHHRTERRPDRLL